MSFQHLDRKALPNYFPEDGAIFMANPLTREECFERKLFGLPANFEDFVLRIKRGMLLFLFDFHSRKLYGVFEASSNGGMNLVPDAYKSSNSKFPAQVRFNILWQSGPLQEDTFADAIMENYFAPYKFNLGLSREQVSRLLYLFRRTKLKIPRSHMSQWYHQRPNRIVTPLDKCHPEEKNHMLRNSRDSGSYSGKREECLCVFKCLSGWSKVIEEKSGRKNARTEHLGKNTNSEEKASVNTNFISGLGNDVKMGAESEGLEKLSGTNVKICKDSKRKDTFLAENRKCLKKTKTCGQLSDVATADLSQGSCKTETSVITGDAVVVSGPSLTKPFICGGGEESVDDKLDRSIQLEISCDQDPVEMLLAQYKDYLRRSRLEDQPDIIGADACVT